MRTASSCPQPDHLSAQPFNPPIQGAEKKQHLSVPCDALHEVAVGRDDNNPGTVAYSVCGIRARAAEFDPTHLSDGMTGSGLEATAIVCPFMYLGGAAVSTEGARVEVAVSAVPLATS